MGKNSHSDQIAGSEFKPYLTVCNVVAAVIHQYTHICTALICTINMKALVQVTQTLECIYHTSDGMVPIES